MKQNRFTDNDYFTKLKVVSNGTAVVNKPGLICNMNKKGCNLTNYICHHRRALAHKCAKRAPVTATERAKNVAVVSCDSALGQNIPPTVVPVTTVLVTKKANMLVKSVKVHVTSDVFVQCLHHFAKCKVDGKPYINFDGASSHLNAETVKSSE
jgi:hypothetical protein